MVDPRTSIICERLKEVKRVIAVSSGKGGVGKSLIACTLALSLAKRGFRVGLLDLDFTSPSTHVILGVKGVQPKEDRGLVPPLVHGIEYMSIVHYSGDLATPLRGVDVSNALIELLSVTRWGKLDFLVLDMPPGIGDAIMDLVRLIEKPEFLIVTTPSQLAFETVRKLAGLLKGLGTPIIGLVENMKMNQSEIIRQQTQMQSLTYLAAIAFDERIEAAIGVEAMLMETALAKTMQNLALRI